MTVPVTISQSIAWTPDAFGNRSPADLQLIRQGFIHALELVYQREMVASRFHHECPDWDSMEIDLMDSEATGCSCFRGNPDADALYAERSKELDALNAANTCECDPQPILDAEHDNACPACGKTVVAA